jgi:hypothetical protein
MDIMMPGVREQPAPAPWLEHRERIKLPLLVCELTAQHPDATPQQIEEELQKRDVDAPRELIALWMRDCNNRQS